jgi:protein-disulfide isomerase
MIRPTRVLRAVIAAFAVLTGMALMVRVTCARGPLADTGALDVSAASPHHPSYVVNARILLAHEDWEELPSGSAASSGGARSDNGVAGADASAIDPGGHPQRGPDDAPVTIIEFGDFQCPYCRAAEGTLREVRQRYGNKVRLVYMDFPLSFHANAMNAAMAARCAGEQGKFWQYHDALFANQAALSADDLKARAESLRLNTAKFDACFDDRKYESDILSDKADGKRAGADGTPYFVINGDPLSGAAPFSAFEVLIDRSLTQQSSQSRSHE